MSPEYLFVSMSEEYFKMHRTDVAYEVSNTLLVTAFYLLPPYFIFYHEFVFLLEIYLKKDETLEFK